MSMQRREAIKRTALAMGGLMFAPHALGVLEGIRARPGRAWASTVFSRDEAALIAELADVIIPSTDTPGAGELGVPAFIDEIVAKVYDAESREKFLEGLRAFNERARHEQGADFVDLDPGQKYEFAAEENRKAVEATADLFDDSCSTVEEYRSGTTTTELETVEHETPFFLMIKELTLLGYFTTEVGATQVLQYEATPGEYIPCAPLNEIGRTWAT